jgi:hypothetical protein
VSAFMGTRYTDSILHLPRSMWPLLVSLGVSA